MLLNNLMIMWTLDFESAAGGMLWCDPGFIAKFAFCALCICIHPVCNLPELPGSLCAAAQYFLPLGQMTVIRHLQRLLYKGDWLKKQDLLQGSLGHPQAGALPGSAPGCGAQWRLRLLSYCLVMQMTLFLQVQCSKKISLGASWVWISWILSCIVWPSGT